MATITSLPQFSLADLEQWAEQGLITPEQAARIQEHLQHLPLQAAPIPHRSRLNLVHIAYYFGGFMILLAYTIFIGLQWQALSASQQISISGFTIIGLWGLGALLRQKASRIAGGLLVFAGTGIVPLLVYSIQQAAEFYDEQAYQDFYRYVDPAWVTLEVISLLVAVAVLARVRFTLISLLVAFWLWFFSMDVCRWIYGGSMWSWDAPEQTLSVIIGVGMLALGALLQRRTHQDYAFWFYLFGHVLVLSNLTSLTLQYEGWLSTLYPTVYVAFVVASVALQRRVFLVFGALGSYGYACYLAFRVFEGVFGFPFARASVGLLIVLTAVGYQKYARPWLERRFAQLRPSTTSFLLVHTASRCFQPPRLKA